MDSSDLDPIEYVLPWDYVSQSPKRHLDRFSLFAGLTDVTDKQTDTQTERSRYSVCSSRPLSLNAMWPKMWDE